MGLPGPSSQLLSSPAPLGDGSLCLQHPEQQLCQLYRLEGTSAANAHDPGRASAAEGSPGSAVGPDHAFCRPSWLLLLAWALLVCRQQRRAVLSFVSSEVPKLSAQDSAWAQGLGCWLASSEQWLAQTQVRVPRAPPSAVERANRRALSVSRKHSPGKSPPLG